MESFQSSMEKGDTVSSLIIWLSIRRYLIGMVLYALRNTSFHVMILCLPCSNSLRELGQVLEQRANLRLREVSDLPKDTQGPSWRPGIHILVTSLLGPVLQRKHWLCMDRSQSLCPYRQGGPSLKDGVE